MFQNSNRGFIRKLALADMKNHRLKTILSGTVILIATCFLSVAALFVCNDAQELAESSPYHGMYKAVDGETLEALRQNPAFGSVGVYKNFGQRSAREYYLQVSYADEHAAGFMGQTFVEGRLPGKLEEVAVSKGYLESLGLPQQLGQRISISYFDRFSGSEQTKEFLVSGIFNNVQQDRMKQYTAIVSEAFREDVEAAGAYRSSSFSDEKVDSLDVLVTLNEEYSSQSSEEKVERLTEIGTSLGIKDYNIALNYSYIKGIYFDPALVVSMVLIGLIVVLSCVFVIYSIFYISAVNSVQMFAKLAALGTTPRQMKKMLRMQGGWLSVRFIPAGIVISWLVLSCLQPGGLQLWNVPISIAIGLFISAVVMISLHRPGKILAEISPAEGMNYGEGYSARRRGTMKQIGPKELASNSMKSSRKKNRMALVSLSISGILFISMAICIHSLDLSRYMQEVYNYNEDYAVGLEMDNFYERLSAVQKANPFTEEFEQAAKEIPGVTEVIRGESVIATVKSPAILDSDGEPYKSTLGNLTPKLLEVNAGEVVEGSLDYEALGEDGVILNKYRIDASTVPLDYHVGDRFRFLIDSGDGQLEREFTVKGIAYFRSTELFYVAQEALEGMTPYNETVSLSIFCDPEYRQSVGDQLEAMIVGNGNLVLRTYEQDYNLMKNFFDVTMYAVYGFCAFIAVFGLLNMTNMLLSGALIRKREFALLQAIGMVTPQLREMLCREGLQTSVKAILIAFLLGTAGGKLLCTIISDVMMLKFVTFRLSVWPFLAFAFILIGLQLLISFSISRSVERNSLTEQLRAE